MNAKNAKGKVKRGRRRFTQRAQMKTKLEELVALAKVAPFTQGDEEAQRRSFAYGNVKIENNQVTRESKTQKPTPKSKSLPRITRIEEERLLVLGSWLLAEPKGKGAQARAARPSPRKTRRGQGAPGCAP